MTLGDLIYKADHTQAQLTSAYIPLKLEGRDVDIDFDIAGDSEHGYIINMIVK